MIRSIGLTVRSGTTNTNNNNNHYLMWVSRHFYSLQYSTVLETKKKIVTLSWLRRTCYLLLVPVTCYLYVYCTVTCSSSSNPVYCSCCLLAKSQQYPSGTSHKYLYICLPKKVQYFGFIPMSLDKVVVVCRCWCWLLVVLGPGYTVLCMYKDFGGHGCCCWSIDVSEWRSKVHNFFCRVSTVLYCTVAVCFVLVFCACVSVSTEAVCFVVVLFAFAFAVAWPRRRLLPCWVLLLLLLLRQSVSRRCHSAGYRTVRCWRHGYATER
jgi:hypothetical protein